MLKKLFNRRSNLIISIVAVLAAALILAWALTGTGGQKNPQALLAAGPDSEGNNFKADFEGGEKIDGRMQTRLTAESGGEAQDIPGHKIDPPLNVKLAGILVDIGKSAWATIIDLNTGKQDLYKVGDSIMGATIRKIDPDRVVLEKGGAFQVLRVTSGGDTVGNPPVANAEAGGSAFTGESGELPYFEPIENTEGPPVDESIQVKELPYFEPFTNSTGPPVDPQGNYEDLPEFVPYESENGPEPE